MDHAVEALRRLIGDTAERRREVADALGANEQSLYQILNGIPLKSGRRRSVGRELREKLDLRFPGWLAPPITTSLTTKGDGTGPADGSATALPPSLAQALPVVLDALARLPPARWASVRAQLDQVATHPEMRDDVLAELQHLLATPAAPPGKRQAPG